jgi:peptidoglycan/xylan/chitin deacetylase (PgdA/CDA1 family)
VRFITDSYYRALRTAGVPAWRRRSNDAALVLCYHNVVAAAGDAAGCAGMHETRDRFEQQMRWLAAHYEMVGLRQLVDRIESGASLRSLAAVTFDDGYAGVFEHAAPVLSALGIPATVFVFTAAIENARPFEWDGAAQHRSASWADIRRAMGAPFEIGVHSMTHASLPAVSKQQLESEIVQSRAIIHEATGVLPDFFAYPYGHWNSRVRDVVQAAGYRAALTLDFGLNRRDVDRWAMRRVNVPARISDAAFEAWAAGYRGLRFF